MHPRTASADARSGRHSASRNVSSREIGSRIDTPGAILTTFLDQTPELELDARRGPAPVLDGSPALDDLAPSVEDVAAVVEHDPTLTPAARIAKPVVAKAASDDEPEVAEHDDLLDIEDSTRLYLREIARVPLLTAEEEVMLAKTMELG